MPTAGDLDDLPPERSVPFGQFPGAVLDGDGRDAAADELRRPSPGVRSATQTPSKAERCDVGMMSPQTRLAISERRSAERQRHDRGIVPAACRRSRPPAAALGPAGRLHQVERRRVVERGGWAGRRLGHGRVLAHDAAQRCPRLVGSARPEARATAATAAADARTVKSFRLSARSAR